MSGYNEDIYTKCPFYQRETGRRIVCEGFSADSISCTTLFNGRTALEKHKDEFCRGSYTNCEFYRVLIKKYE